MVLQLHSDLLVQCLMLFTMYYPLQTTSSTSQADFTVLIPHFQSINLRASISSVREWTKQKSDMMMLIRLLYFEDDLNERVE